MSHHRSVVRRPFLALAFPFSLLAACGGGGGGGDGYCSGSFEGGNTGFSCTACNGLDPFNDNPLAAAIDNDSGTYQGFGFPTGGGTVTLTIRARGDMSFPAGANAGALIRFPAGTAVNASYSLYNGNTPVAATSGGTIATGSTPSGAGNATYYAVTPSATIDRIDLSISAPTAANFQLNEVCGDH